MCLPSQLQRLRRRLCRSKVVNKENSSLSTSIRTSEGLALEEKKDDYVLRRDYVGSSRLNLQYYLWKDSLQFNLHPSIPTLGPNARIADVATGTGIWLIDVARNVSPDIQLDGFDISLAQCPPDQWLPANINLQTWDMYTEPPRHLIGQYDIVHVRLIMLIIKDNDPLPIVRNLRKLLKPGGYLQWDEVDRVRSYIESVDDAVYPKAIETLFLGGVNSPKGQSVDLWQDNLPKTLDANGFASSQLYRFKTDLTTARFFHDMYMTAWEEYIIGVFGGIKGKMSQLTNQAVEEAQNGAAVAFPKLVWVARAA